MEASARSNCNDPFDVAAAVWRDLWQSIPEDVRAGWETPYFDSGLRDGDPIFSAVNRKERQHIRVRQALDPAEDMDRWADVDVFARGEPEETRGIVVTVPYGPAHLSDARDLVVHWLRSGTLLPGW